MTEFKNHKKAWKVSWRVRTLDLWRADFSLFRELLERILWQVSMKMKEAWESWLKF